MHQTESDIIFSVIVASAAFGIIAVFFVLVIINHYRIHARKQKDIFNAVLETQNKERKRISEDLHDELGPLLSGIKIRVGALRDMDDDAAREEMIKEAEGSLDKAVQEVRVITKNLMPRYIEEHGLVAELEELQRLVEISKAVKVNLRLSGLEKRLNPLFEINLFRIINELLNNAVRHSRANTIDIEIDYNRAGLLLAFSDNGKGFTPEIKHNGIGLKNIESRINLFKGKYKIESAHNNGTCFKINFHQDDLIRKQTV